LFEGAEPFYLKIDYAVADFCFLSKPEETIFELNKNEIHFERMAEGNG
jgi:hypothetical protein